MRIRRLLCLVMALLSFWIASAQTPYHKMSSFPSRSVSSFMQDSDGMMWMASTSGLIRFNGKDYFSYTSSSDTTSIPDNYINTILVEGDDVWISTNNGLCRYAYESGFVRERRIRDYMPVYAVARRDESTLYLSTESSIDIFDISRMERISSNKGNFFTRATSFCVSQDYICQVSKYDNAVEILSRDLDILVHVNGESLGGTTADLGNGDFLFYSDTGLHCISASQKKETEVPSWLSSLNTRGIFLLQKDADNLYIGIQGKGVHVCSLSSRTIQKLDYSPDVDNYSAGYIDRDENLWVSDNGAYRISVSPKRMSSMSSLVKLNDVISLHHGLRRLLYDNAGSFYIQTLDGAVLEYKKDKESSEVLRYLDDDQQTLYLCSDEFYSSNFFNRRVLHLSLDRNHPKPLNEFKLDRPVMDVFSDKSRGVYLVCSDSLRIMSSDRIYAFSYPVGVDVRKGRFDESIGNPIFISLSNGVYQLEQDGAFIQLFDNKKWGVSNSKYFHQDHNGNYWIGTISGGVYFFNTQSQSITLFNVENGLTDNSITNICEVGDNVLVGTLDGLNVISLSDMTIRKLFFNDRPLLNCYVEEGSYVMPDSSVYLASAAGVIHLDLSSIEPQLPSDLYVESVSINGKSVGWVDKDGHFRSSTLEEKQLSNLSHSQNNFEFDFCSIDFRNNPDNIYRYRMDGLGLDWIRTENNNISYPHLPPGRYTFELCQLGADNHWTEPLSFSFRIRPPLSKTTVAFILYVLFAIGSIALFVYLYIRWKINRQTIQFMEQDSLLNKRISEMKINFFTNISHEFRTPLTLITSPLEQLKKDPDRQDKDFLFSIVDRNVGKMLRLTDDLLEYNRQIPSLKGLDLESGDVLRFVSETVNMFQFNASNKAIDITLSSDENDYNCMFDSSKLNDVLSNLIGNAVKYSPKKSHISVELKILPISDVRQEYQLESPQAQRYIEISVKDNGKGIPDDQKESIFFRYQRVGDKTQQMQIKGFGIGLDYTRQLVHLLGGKIIVRDNDPCGSVFSFVMPLLSPSENMSVGNVATSSAKTDVTLSGDYTQKTVLVVEDDPDMREYLEKMLKSYCQVVSMPDGKQCLDFLDEHEADLIICDRMMPVMDGDALVRNIRSREENISLPVIMLTAMSDISSQLEGLGLGVDAYITKPFNLDYLIASVYNLLSKRVAWQKQVLKMTSSTISDSSSQELTSAMSSSEKAFLESLYSLFDSHLSDTEYTLNDICSDLGMSRTSFFTKVKNLTGENPSHLFNAYKMNKAKELLQSKEYNLSEISDMVGFATLASFSRAFKDYFGVAPSKYES